MNYRYKAFGLLIESVLELPELVEVSEEVTEVDVEVVYAELPDFKGQSELNDGWFWLDSKGLFFEVDEVAKFKVSKGCKIEIKRHKDVDDDNVRLFLLGSAMAGVFHQRGLLPVHASVLKYNNRTLLIAGDSGAGKSTAAFALYQLGASLVADDVAVLQEKESRLEVASGYPQMKLWESSLNLFNIDSSKLKQVRPGEDKFRFIPERFEDSAQNVDELIFLERTEGELDVMQLKGMDLLKMISKHVFRPFFSLNDDAYSILLFSLFKLLSQDVNCYLVRRNPDAFQYNELIQLIENKRNEIHSK